MSLLRNSMFAATLLAFALASRADDIRRVCPEASAAYWAADYVEAAELYETCLESFDGEPIDLVLARHGLGLARSMAGDEEGAILAYDAAIAVDPAGHFVPLILHDRAKALSATGRHADAMADLRAALALALERRQPNDAVAALMGLDERKDTRDASFVPVIRETLASIAYLAGDLATAEEQARLALGGDPQCYDCWNVIGLVADERGDFEHSVSAYGRAIKMADNDAGATPEARSRYQSNRSYALMRLDRLPEALADTEVAIGLDHRGATSYIVMGMVKARLGDPDGAMETFMELYERADSVGRLALQSALLEAGLPARSDGGDLREAVENGFRECVQTRCDFWSIP